MSSGQGGETKEGGLEEQTHCPSGTWVPGTNPVMGKQRRLHLAQLPVVLCAVLSAVCAALWVLHSTLGSINRAGQSGNYCWLL